MKQIDFIFDTNKVSIDGMEMLKDYWAFKKINGIESFVLTENEFLNKYTDLYCLQELRNVFSFAVYEVDQCDVCLKPYGVIINDREQLKSHINSKLKCCRVCGNFQSSIKNSDAQKNH